MSCDAHENFPMDESEAMWVKFNNLNQYKSNLTRLNSLVEKICLEFLMALMEPFNRRRPKFFLFFLFRHFDIIFHVDEIKSRNLPLVYMIVNMG